MRHCPMRIRPLGRWGKHISRASVSVQHRISPALAHFYIRTVTLWFLFTERTDKTAQFLSCRVMKLCSVYHVQSYEAAVLIMYRVMRLSSVYHVQREKLFCTEMSKWNEEMNKQSYRKVVFFFLLWFYAFICITPLCVWKSIQIFSKRDRHDNERTDKKPSLRWLLIPHSFKWLGITRTPLIFGLFTSL